MTRPCRRMTRHLLQIFLTLGLTFTVLPYFPVRAGVPGRHCSRSRAPEPERGNPVLTAGGDPMSFVAVDDAPAGEVVRTQLHYDSVLGQDADVVLPHLAADVSQDLVAILKLDPEHGVRERLDDPALHLDGSVFLGHILRYLTLDRCGRLTGHSRVVE